MKFKASFSSVGVNWLERFVPIFDKLGKELSVLLTPNTLHLIQGHAVSGGLELHADLLQEEVFDEYKISSNNGDKIAFKLEPAVLYRVLRGLIGSEATFAEMKLIKRVVAPDRSLPFLNFSSKGIVDIVQDVPLAGPLNRREVEDLEVRAWGEGLGRGRRGFEWEKNPECWAPRRYDFIAPLTPRLAHTSANPSGFRGAHHPVPYTQALVQANVVNVPYWLNMDRLGTEAMHASVERFRAVGPKVELATTKAGVLHLTTSRGGAVTLGVEYRGINVLPPVEDQGAGEREEDGEDEAGGVAYRLAEAKASGSAAAVSINTKHLWKGLTGVASNPSNCLIGVAGNLGHVELVYRYDRQAVNGADAVGLMVRLPVEEEDELQFE